MVYLDPKTAEGWLWLSGVVDFPQQVRYCLERTLRIDPSNERGKRGLEWLDAREKEIDEAQKVESRLCFREPLDVDRLGDALAQLQPSG